MPGMVMTESESEDARAPPVPTHYVRIFGDNDAVHRAWNNAWVATTNHYAGLPYDDGVHYAISHSDSTDVPDSDDDITDDDADDADSDWDSD